MMDEKVHQWIRDNGYIFISMQDDFSTKHNRDKVCFKDQNGYKYCSRFHHLTHRIIPQKFYKSNPFTIDNIRLWAKENQKEFELVSTTYIGATKPLKWMCKKCEKIFLLSWNHIKNGEGCRHCKYGDFGIFMAKPNDDSGNLLLLYPDVCEEWDYALNDKNPSEYKPYSEQLVWWKCNLCDNPYQMRIIHRTKEGCSCPKCKMSHGEKKIYEYFLRNNIDFLWQHRFDDCRNKRRLPFDFYVPSHNLCIEFQGEQHYSPYDFKTFSKTSEDAHRSFERVKLTDSIKKEYCKNNNIGLLEIRHDETRRIDRILDEYFKNN